MLLWISQKFPPQEQQNNDFLTPWAMCLKQRNYIASVQPSSFPHSHGFSGGEFIRGKFATLFFLYLGIEWYLIQMAYIQKGISKTLAHEHDSFEMWSVRWVLDTEDRCLDAVSPQGVWLRASQPVAASLHPSRHWVMVPAPWSLPPIAESLFELWVSSFSLSLPCCVMRIWGVSQRLKDSLSLSNIYIFHIQCPHRWLYEQWAMAAMC